MPPCLAKPGKNQSWSLPTFLPRVKERCDTGHSKSSIDYGVYTMDFLSDNPDMTYIEESCEMGSYMGYYRMGELLLRKNKMKEAKLYFEKS